MKCFKRVLKTTTLSLIKPFLCLCDTTQILMRSKDIHLFRPATERNISSAQMYNFTHAIAIHPPRLFFPILIAFEELRKKSGKGDKSDVATATRTLLGDSLLYKECFV